jgi:hypothetical protein
MDQGKAATADNNPTTVPDSAPGSAPPPVDPPGRTTDNAASVDPFCLPSNDVRRETPEPAAGTPPSRSAGSSDAATKKHRPSPQIHPDAARQWKQLRGWSLFWTFVFVFLGFMIASSRIAQPAKLLIATAVISTAVFAHFSILLPFMKPRNGLVHYSGAVFFLIIVIGVISIALGAYYIDLAFYDPTNCASTKWFNLDPMKKSIQNSWLPFLTVPLEWFSKWHTSFYAGIFFVTDLLIAMYAVPKHLRAEFSKVTWFIDGPMIIGIGYANFVHLFVRDVDDLFLAGAVSLQLFAANIALMVFKLNDCLRLAKSSRRRGLVSLESSDDTGMLLTNKIRSALANARRRLGGPLHQNDNWIY